MHAALIFHIFQKFGCWRGCGAVSGAMVAGLSIVLAMHPALAKPAERCTEPVFGAAGIFVDQRADTAEAARTIGVEAAAQNAFETVLGRVLLSPEERDRFVGLHGHDAFTDFVHIIEENNLEKRYIAKLDFCFDAERLRAAFIAEGIQWAELSSPSILVLPVWQGPDGVRAWLKDNQWLSGWRDTVTQYNGLVRLRSLAHSLTHERRFRGEDIVAADPIKLAAAARITKAEQVMVVLAHLDYVGAKQIVDVEARLFDKNGQPIATIMSLPDISLTASDMQPLDSARQRIIARMEGTWRAANSINTNAAGYLLVSVPVTSVKEWSERLDALQQIAVIRNFAMRTLDTKGATISLELAGSREALQNALVPHGLALVDAGDTVSIVRAPDTQ